jgi:hypothetical protein
MENTLDTLFGPLSKQYCIWFYGWSIFSFILLFGIILGSLIVGITKRKGIDFYILMIIGLIPYVAIYFQNRLLYSMCVGNNV